MGSCAWSNAAGGRLNCFLPQIMKVEKKPGKTPISKTKAVNKSDMKTGNVAGKEKSSSKDDKSSGSKKEINVGSASVHSPPRASRTGGKSKSVDAVDNVKNKNASVKSEINKSKKQVSSGKQKATEKNVRKSVDISESDILLQDKKVKDGVKIDDRRDGSTTRGPHQASNSGLKQSQEESAKKTPTLNTKSSKLVTGTSEKKADMAGECKDAKKIESEKKMSEDLWQNL